MRRIPILLLLFSGLSLAAPMTNQQASDAGKTLGQTQDALITPQINQTNADAKIKHVTGAPTETQFFGGGKADNFTPGGNKRIACNTGTPSSDAFTRQSCDAVNLIAKAPNQRPSIAIARNNPMLQREQSVRADAAHVAFGATGTGGSGASNPNGFGIAGTYSDCTTTTTPDPGTTEIKTCVDYMTATETTTNPTCQKSVATTQSCHQVMSFTVFQPAAIPASVSYSCTTGTLSGTTCIQPTFPASVNYQCSAGSTLSGTNCQPAPTTATLSYSCTSGTLSGTQCLQPATSASVTYLCPSGSTLSGTNCIWPAQQGATVNATVGYVAAYTAFWVDDGNWLWLERWSNYYYPSYVGYGTLFEYAGLPDVYHYYTPADRTNLICTARGYVRGTILDNNAYSGAVFTCDNQVYSCPSGYTRSGTMCYPSPTTPPPTSATPIYSCPSGSTLSGTSCLWPSTAATASYSCPTGSSLSGTLCYPAPTAATVVYTCPSGNTLSGTTCQPPATQATVTYSCGTGATYNGTQCVFPPVVTETFTDNCATLQAKTQ